MTTDLNGASPAGRVSGRPLWESLTDPRHVQGVMRAYEGDAIAGTTWDQGLAGGRRVAAGLRRRGVRPGARVATVLTNSREVVEGIVGIWMAGGVVASLPVPARGMSLPQYCEQLAGLCTGLEAELLLAEGKLLSLVPEVLMAGVRLLPWEQLPVSARPADPCFAHEDEIVFIQYSSGSTRMPKGCALTARAIGAQLGILSEMAEAEDSSETVVCWLPLSHDMGVFGCLLFAWSGGHDLVLSSPERFTRSPRTWFTDCAMFGATLTAGTNTALHAATRSVAAMRSGIASPIRLKVCVVGAERVDAGTLRRASEVLVPYGFSPAAFMPAYGLAEATLVVSATGVRELPHAVAVDTFALADGRVELVSAELDSATHVMSVGRPCAGVQVRLDRPGELSEVLVRSPSLARGYWGDEERTRERFAGGELRSGDLGFELEGQLYLAGRTDDLLSVGGRNVYAREIEAAVGLLPDIRTGCCTLIDLPDTEGRSALVLLMELATATADQRSVAESAAELAMSKAGVEVDRCVFLRKGTLPKTPTGKIQRFRCRQLLAQGALDQVGHVDTT